MITQKKSSKGERTKDLILHSAISMFQELGYEATTMRGIAEKCGVALGNAYYYFPSKEHLVLGLYALTLDDQIAACQPVLRSARTMKRRLTGVLHAELAALLPYRMVLRSLFRFGADPDSPLSPFGADSIEIRQKAQLLFDSVIVGSQEKVPSDLRDALPYCLWLYHMGIIFFWLHDSSTDQQKTKRFIELSSELIVTFILLMSVAILKPVRSTLLKLINEFRLDATTGGAQTVALKK